MKKLIIILLMLAGSAHAKNLPLTSDERIFKCGVSFNAALKADTDIDSKVVGKPETFENGVRLGNILGVIKVMKQSYIYYSCDVNLWNRVFLRHQITQEDVDLNVNLFRENWR